MSHYTKVKIGTWHERESRDITYCPSYYAADTETLRTIPGDVEAFVLFSGGYTMPMPYWLVVTVPATRVCGRLYNGFGGVNYSHTELPAGEDCPYHTQMYVYGIPELVEQGKLTLDPEFAFLALKDQRAMFNACPQTWEALAELRKVTA